MDAPVNDPSAVENQFAQALQEHPTGQPIVRAFHVVDDMASSGAPGRDELIAAQASAMLDSIAQDLALLGPAGWEEFSAVFSLTVVAGSATCWFWAPDGSEPVTVPGSIVERVREQRELSAQMSAGPWWRLLLSVSRQGQLRVSYDYGDEPLPPDELQPPKNYRADLAAYPRRGLPVWLAGYLAGPEMQGRSPEQVAAAVAADMGAGREAVASDDIEPLTDTWARWAVLAAAYVGARSQRGPRIASGMATYESDARSGSSLILLPGERAVLSGGGWKSPLLAAAYQDQQPLPDLYRGAPDWVNDAALNPRNQHGLLSFCYWWTDGQWWRGGTDTFDELDDPLPAIWTAEETVAAMTVVTGPATRDACSRLLVAATDRLATPDDLAAVFVGYRNPDIGSAHHQLRLADLTR